VLGKRRNGFSSRIPRCGCCGSSGDVSLHELHPPQVVAQGRVENQHEGLVLDGCRVPFGFFHHNGQGIDLVMVVVLAFQSVLGVVFLLSAVVQSSKPGCRRHAGNLRSCQKGSGQGRLLLLLLWLGLSLLLFLVLVHCCCDRGVVAFQGTAAAIGSIGIVAAVFYDQLVVPVHVTKILIEFRLGNILLGKIVAGVVVVFVVVVVIDDVRRGGMARAVDAVVVVHVVAFNDVASLGTVRTAGRLLLNLLMLFVLRGS